MYLLVFVTSVFGKFSGVFLSSRAFGLSTREAACVGVMMNSKGLVEVIVLNLGLDFNVINTAVFTLMVLSSITTTMFTTPTLRMVYSDEFRREEALRAKQNRTATDELANYKNGKKSKHDYELKKLSRASKELERQKLNHSAGDAEEKVETESYGIATAFLRNEEVVSLSFFLSHLFWKGCDLTFSVMKFVETSADTIIKENMLSMAAATSCPLCLDGALKIVHAVIRGIGADMNYDVCVGKMTTFDKDLVDACNRWLPDLILIPLYRESGGVNIHGDFFDSSVHDYMKGVSEHAKDFSVAFFLDQDLCSSPFDAISKKGFFDIALVLHLSLLPASSEILKFAAFLSKNPSVRFEIFCVSDVISKSRRDELDKHISSLKSKGCPHVMVSDINQEDEVAKQLSVLDTRYEFIAYSSDWNISNDQNSPTTFLGSFGKLLLESRVETPLLAFIKDSEAPMATIAEPSLRDLHSTKDRHSRITVHKSLKHAAMSDELNESLLVTHRKATGKDIAEASVIVSPSIRADSKENVTSSSLADASMDPIGPLMKKVVDSTRSSKSSSADIPLSPTFGKGKLKEAMKSNDHESIVSRLIKAEEEAAEHSSLSQSQSQPMPPSSEKEN
jgi:hypothetical protein